MNFLLKSSICLAALVWAGAAVAQDADPIGALLDQAPAMDEDQAEALGQPPEPAPQAAPLTAPTLPAPSVPPPLTTPASTPPIPPAPTYTPPPPPPQAAPVYAPPPPRVPAPQPTATPYPYGSGSVSPYDPPPSVPPAYVPPPRPQLTSPVMVDQLDRTPEAPLNPTELGYESRLRNSFASAQGLQGPLDGAWTLRGPNGQALYSLLLVDKGLGQLEGAWRDPRRRGATDSSGFLADIRRMGAQLNGSFYPHPGAGAVTFTLSQAADGGWSGEIDEGGRRNTATLKRD